jgi:hypothetical protein
MTSFRGMHALALFLLLALVQPGACRSSYQNAVPNGGNVPGSRAIGHVSTSGGGARNAFGVDFETSGRRWTGELCRKDSDGDGRSNGEELGDPECTWQVGDTPARTTRITHPGVDDEPITAEQAEADATDAAVSALSLPPWIIAHAALMGVAWIIVAPIGALFAVSPARRALGPSWFTWHSRVMFVAVLLTTIGAVLSIVSVGSHADTPHKVLGLAIFGLAVLQPINAAIRPHLPPEPAPGDEDAEDAGKEPKPAKSTARQTWEFLHKNIGRILVIVAFANLGLGIAITLQVYA